MSLQKSCVVAGTGPGNGAALARAFSKEGFHIVLLARSSDFIQSLASELGNATAITCELSDEASIAQAAKKIESECPPVEVLIFNAGGASTFRPGTLLNVSASDLLKTIAARTTGPLSLSQHILPGMVTRKKGSVFFTGATASTRGSKNFALLAIPSFGLNPFIFLNYSKYGGLFMEQSFSVCQDTTFPKMTVVNGKWFDRVIVTFLENTDYAHALAQSPLSELHTTHNGTLLINYHGVTHPSQPNYVAFATGDLKVKDDVVRDIEGESLVDLLERKGVSWGSYCEEYPDNWTGEKPFLDHAHGRYVRRHNPFASLKSVQDNPTRAKNIKSAEAFKRELESNTLPSFVFYTPCQDNNAHDTNITYAARYIKNFYTPLTAHPVFQSQRTLFVLTFDESASYVFGQNRVATWLLGNAVKSTPLTLQSQLYKSIDWEWAIPSIKENTINTDKPSIDKPNWYISNVINLCRVALPTGNPSEPPKEGNWNDSKFNHYDILKTIEENWGLGDLGLNDVSAKGFGEVLRRRDERE